jgi:hypothetical protein
VDEGTHTEEMTMAVNQIDNDGTQRPRRKFHDSATSHPSQRLDLSCRATLDIIGPSACKPAYAVHVCRGWVSRRGIRIRAMLAGRIGPLGRCSGR